MRTLVDARLRDQARRYGFRFACEDCAHATRPSSDERPRGSLECSLGYPAEPHRCALAESHLTLCKAFELG